MQTWHLTHPVERRLMAMYEDGLGFRRHSRASLRCWPASRARDFGSRIESAQRANCNVQHVLRLAFGRVGILRRQRGETAPRLCALYGENWAETIKPLPPEAISAQIEADLGGAQA
ncbi:hypothetical protein [Caballeronia sp. LZ035]|uniref:hypothetical protein n=1 Tax=Caballeronia sp. LZ035 TaxID=3038568 RepID=UPI002855C56E|nr:hypothetical protein [Caballeronia sp. LZ035]MDR5763404.1 hypothetical protein [Caballeronia sp. LZ035]